MPGLTGIISPVSEPERTAELDRMLARVHREDFYDAGTFNSEGAGLSLGWTSYRGAHNYLPFRDTQGHILFLYGETFGPSESHDTEMRTLPALFASDRRKALRSLNGWFNGVFVDPKQNEVVVFTDRYGMQRLYYHQDADSFLFSSEAKALLAARAKLRALDPQSVGELLSCDCVLENRTLFKGISTIPGAATWTFRNGRLIKQETYFEPEEWENQALLDGDEFMQELQAVFRRIVPQYLQSNLPLGVSLTGGLDTRAVMAFVDHQSQTLPCYTFGGMYRESFDVKIARKVASVCGQRHQVIPLRNDFLTDFADLAERTVRISDGCLGACEAYELYYNTRARQIADVRVTGNYGSEVLRGTRAFKAIPPDRRLLSRDAWMLVAAAEAKFKEISGCHPLTFAVFRQAPWYGYGRLSVEQSQLIPRTPFMDNDLVGLMYRAPQQATKSTAVTECLIKAGDPRLSALPTDRVSMNGVRTPSTFMKYVFSRLLFKGDYYCKSGMPQWLEQLHYMFRALELERLVVGRHRLTFFRGWFRGELADYLKDLLLDPAARCRPYIDGNHLEMMVNRHIKGDRNYTTELQRLINLELILRQLIEK
jgi:asparagine synthase (glutamine-hydrolysing)